MVNFIFIYLKALPRILKVSKCIILFLTECFICSPEYSIIILLCAFCDLHEKEIRILENVRRNALKERTQQRMEPDEVRNPA